MAREKRVRRKARAGDGFESAELSTAEAGALVGVHPETIRRWCKSGAFRCRFCEREAGKQRVPAWKVNRASFLKWWENEES